MVRPYAGGVVVRGEGRANVCHGVEGVWEGSSYDMKGGVENIGDSLHHTEEELVRIDVPHWKGEVGDDEGFRVRGVW